MPIRGLVFTLRISPYESTGRSTLANPLARRSKLRNFSKRTNKSGTKIGTLIMNLLNPVILSKTLLYVTLFGMTMRVPF